MQDVNDAIKELKKLKANRVFIQYPEGIKLKIEQIAKKIEQSGIEVVICVEECFGACDVRDFEAKLLGCDVVLHIGHEKFFDSKLLPVVFWEYFIDVDPVPIVEKELSKLDGFERIGLVTSIQFVHSLPAVKQFLERVGKKVFTHKDLQHEGQVLGCRLDAATAIEKKVDCFLCITAGKFYALGIVLETSKPVFCLDLERKQIESLDDFKKKIEKILAWNRVQLKDARRVGLLVSWKKGQFNAKVFDVKKKLERKGKEVFVLAMDKITPDKLYGLKLDACVNFACRRLGIDDIQRFEIPIVNFDQLD
jgi:2-(3-amino-3-carboxypropyl)histidine synthase